MLNKNCFGVSFSIFCRINIYSLGEQEGLRGDDFESKGLRQSLRGERKFLSVYEFMSLCRVESHQDTLCHVHSAETKPCLLLLQIMQLLVLGLKHPSLVCI